MNFFLQNAPISALLLVSFVLIASSFPIECHKRQTKELRHFNWSENPLKTLKAGLEVLDKFTVSVMLYVHIADHVWTLRK